MKVITQSLKHTLIHNFVGGIAWGLGITVGVALVGYMLGLTVSAFGGLPLVGEFLATVVDATLKSLNGN